MVMISNTALPAWCKYWSPAASHTGHDRTRCEAIEGPGLRPVRNDQLLISAWDTVLRVLFWPNLASDVSHSAFNLHIVSNDSLLTADVKTTDVSQMHSVHHGHPAAQQRCPSPASLCLRSRSRPQISQFHRPAQHAGLHRPVSRHARDHIICSASSQTLSAGSAKPLRFIQHKEEAFWFYRFLSIVYDHIGEHRQ